MNNLAGRIDKLLVRLESVERQLAQGPPAGPASGASAACDSGETPAAQREFDELVNTHLRPLLPFSKDVSQTLADQLQLFIDACAEESRLIGAAARSKKPAQDKIPKLLEPLSKKIAAVQEYKDKFGRNKEFNNIAGVAEGAPVLTWVAIEPTPAPYLNDIIPGSEFYTNRVLVASKGKDENQVKWAKEFNAFLKNLQAYVKRMHTTGLAWNPQGGDVFALLGSTPAASIPAAPAGAPPAPPPPPAGLLDQPRAESKAPAAPNTAGMFAELNKGTEISKGLKHVSADMKTKNRSSEEKAKGGLQPKETGGKAPQAAAPATAKAPKPPRKELQGTKWLIENQVNAQIVIEETERNQSFYIGNCQKTTVQIKGKVNSIAIDGCTKTGVVCDNTLASVELVNCNSCQLQVIGKTPSLSVDKVNGLEIYLSKDALDKDAPTNIFTSKSSSVNVMLPGATPDADLLEVPIPEQFLTVWRNGKLVTDSANLSF